MIKYSLRCSSNHHFESWFKDSSTFEGLREDGHVSCPLCGDWDVHKALMTPHLANNAGKNRGAEQEVLPPSKEISLKSDPAESASETIGPIDTIPRAPKAGEPMPSQEEITAAFQFFAKLKRHVEETHEDVGEEFADEARKIHYGETRERGIYGHADQDDVEELIEEGIVVMPLPNVRHDA